MSSRLYIRTPVPLVADIPRRRWIDTHVRQALTDGGHHSAILPWNWPVQPRFSMRLFLEGYEFFPEEHRP